MFIIEDELSGLSSDQALFRISRMGILEAQAQALIRHSYLTRTPSGRALMKRLASPTTPSRQHLFDVLQAEHDRKENAKKAKAEAGMKQAAVAEETLVFPSLFEMFESPAEGDTALDKALSPSSSCAPQEVVCGNQ
jgi:hypothetical protein